MKILEIHSRVNTIEEIKEVAEFFDIFYLMGIWEVSEYSKYFNKKYNQDGSLFSISGYDIDKRILSLFFKLKELGKKIIVDFIPNHIGINQENKKYTMLDEGKHKRGYSGYEYWQDVFQIDWTNKNSLDLIYDIHNILYFVDGLRVDMAHLLLAEEYEKNHSKKIDKNFWKYFIDFTNQDKNKLIVAETYGYYERLKQEGFNYVYRIEPKRKIPISPDDKDLMIVDNHDEELCYWQCSQDLYSLEMKLKELNIYKNTMWYLPAIMGYTNKPSANWYVNRDWKINQEIKNIYIQELKN